MVPYPYHYVQAVSHWPSQWGWVIFDPHSSKTTQPIFVKLEICNYLPDSTPRKMLWSTST